MVWTRSLPPKAYYARCATLGVMRALLLVVIAACGSAKGPAEPVTNRAAPPPKPACTEDRIQVITHDLRARWRSPELSIVHCTPGLFPTPGFFVEVVDRDEDHHVGVVSVDGRITLVPFEIEDQRTIATSVIECATVDLDGDGIDEVVETWRKSAHDRMGSDTWLEVRRIVDHELMTIRGPHTSVFHPDLGSCTAEVRLAGHTIVITVERSSDLPPSDCLAAGTHTFALEGDEIVEIDATRLSRR